MEEDATFPELLKRRSREESRTVKDFLALSAVIDPFYADQPDKHKKAQWFTAIWAKFHCRPGQHLRGIHYKLVNDPESKRAEDTPYANTQADWNYLARASQYARYPVSYTHLRAHET